MFFYGDVGDDVYTGDKKHDFDDGDDDHVDDDHVNFFLLITTLDNFTTLAVQRRFWLNVVP